MHAQKLSTHCACFQILLYLSYSLYVNSFFSFPVRSSFTKIGYVVFAMKPYSLLIITDNVALRERLETYFSSIPLISLLPSGVDGPSGVVQAKLYEPDMMLLDMLMPRMDGIAVLRWLQAENCCRNTRIFALSSMKGEEAIQLGESLGVTYQIQMPTDEGLIFSRMMDFAPDRDGSIKQYRNRMRENDLNLQIDEAITFLFRHMGCPVNLAEYYQAKTVISYCVRNRGKAIFLSKEAYPYAAQIHGVNAKQIERNIRNFIEVTWTRGDMKAQHKIFGNTVEDAKTRPTNKEFIANLTQYTGIK